MYLEGTKARYKIFDASSKIKSTVCHILANAVGFHHFLFCLDALPFPVYLSNCIWCKLMLSVFQEEAILNFQKKR